MTISSTTNTVSYTGNGSTTAFAVPYVFFGTGTTSEVEVVEVVIATGAETVKSNGSDYTVAGGSQCRKPCSWCWKSSLFGSFARWLTVARI